MWIRANLDVYRLVYGPTCHILNDRNKREKTKG